MVVGIKRISTTLALSKIMFVMVTFNYQGKWLFLPSLIIVAVILIAEIIAILIKKKHKKRYLLITILLFFSMLPIMSVGVTLGPTLGSDIKFNRFLWNQHVNQTVKYWTCSTTRLVVSQVLQNTAYFAVS